VIEISIEINNINNINVNNRSPVGQSGAGGWVSIHEMTLTLDVIGLSMKSRFNAAG
jgi:hypothetical protein